MGINAPSQNLDITPEQITQKANELLTVFAQARTSSSLETIEDILMDLLDLSTNSGEKLYEDSAAGGGETLYDIRLRDYPDWEKTDFANLLNTLISNDPQLGAVLAEIKAADDEDRMRAARNLRLPEDSSWDQICYEYNKTH